MNELLIKREKKMNRFILSLLAVLLCTGVAWADDITYEDSSSGLTFTLDTENNTAEVAASSSYTGDITVPETITYESTTYNVTSIAEKAFASCAITSIDIPGTVTSLNNDVFSRCTALTKVTLGEGFTTLGSTVFWYCITLTDISLPSTLTSIGQQCFDRCYALEEITIPASVTTIGDYAFYDCSALTNIEIPGSVTSIGQQCFLHNTSLETLTLNEGLTTIGYAAFYQCYSLTGVTIPSTVTSLGTFAFASCTSLATAAFAEGTTLTSIPYACFNATALTSVTIPASVTSIDTYAFCNTQTLSEVTFEEGSALTSIGQYAFCNCYGIKALTIPENVTTLGTFAFSGCIALETVTFEGNAFTSIPNYCFAEDTVLMSIAIPSTVTSIGQQAFCHCPLTNIELPNGLTELGYGAFNENELTEVDIPSSVTTIGDYCFHGNDDLSEVRIHSESLTTFGQFAFHDCSSDLKIYVPPYSLSSYKSGWQWTTTDETSSAPAATRTSTTYSYDSILYPFYELEVTEAGASTLALPFSASIPDGVSVYTLKGLNADYTRVCGEQITTTLWRDMPVYITAEEGTYTFYGTSNSADSVSASTTTPKNGWMTGAYTSGTYVPKGSYVLQNLTSNGVSFYQVENDNSISLPAFRAYLTVDTDDIHASGTSSGSTSNAPRSLDLDLDGTTSIQNVYTTDAAADDNVYDMQGVRRDADNLPKGIYIRGGKKFIIK